MEENTVELIDYIRVVWKQKILVILGTLVCIAAGVALCPRSQVAYRSEATLRIGTTIDSSRKTSVIDTPANLAKIIPIEYSLEGDEALGYGLGVEMIARTALININVKGPDREKTKEFLKKTIERIIEDHGILTGNICKFYKLRIEEHEAELDKITEEFNKESLVLSENKISIEEEKALGTSNSEIRLFLLLSVQNNMNNKQSAIRSLQENIFSKQSVVKYLEERKTTLIGRVGEGVDIRDSKRRYILLTGFGGLTISIFLAFFVEHLGNVRENEKRKSMS
jgi:uncharacterized protein involved in exopolysaccharide biosynthesis